jgi:hypothetical protein
VSTAEQSVQPEPPTVWFLTLTRAGRGPVKPNFFGSKMKKLADSTRETRVFSEFEI